MSAELDRWFPPRGQCLICGVPGVDQRHRVLDAVVEQVAAGEDPAEVGVEMGLPLEAVRVAVRDWKG